MSHEPDLAKIGARFREESTEALQDLIRLESEQYQESVIRLVEQELIRRGASVPEPGAVLPTDDQIGKPKGIGRVFTSVRTVVASEGFHSKVAWWIGISFGVLVLWPVLAILVGRPWSYVLGVAVILPVLFRRQLVLIYETLFTDKWNHLRGP